MTGGAPLRLFAVGDIGIVGRLGERLAGEPSPFPFQGIAEHLRRADLLFGNFEIPISGGAAIASHESPRLESPPAAAERVAAAGFHVLSIANNHVMDFGVSGLEATRRLLEAQGIAVVGAGANLAEARRPVVLERGGKRVGFLAYCIPCSATAEAERPGAAPLHLTLVREDIERLRPVVDFIVVSVHFGMMYLEYPTPEDLGLARAIIACGADLLIGHHPHVLQGVEEKEGRAIAFSLGEFVFDPQAGNYYAKVARETRRHAAIFRAELGAEGVRVLPPLPTWAGDDLCPRLLEGERAEQALESLGRLSRALDDAEARARFWDYAGERLMAYEVSGLWDEIRRGEIAHFVARLPRLRPRHLKLVAGYLRARLAGRGGGA